MNFRLISILALGVASAAAHAVSFTANFDDIATGTAVTDQYAAKGLTLSGATVTTGSYAAHSASNYAKATGKTITGTLSKYCNQVNVWFRNTGASGSRISLTTFDSTGKRLGFISSSTRNSWANLGIGPGSKRIASFTITTTGANGSFSMDDLTVAPVPEPASMAALGVGLLALRRRKKA